MNRRAFVLSGSALLATRAPARATPAQVADLIANLIGTAGVADSGLKLDLPLMVENGNVVAMTVTADPPPAGIHVESLHVFAEANPLPEVLTLRFGPASARPSISTRIRLATSQKVIAIAKLSDGSFRRDEVDLLVTLAACID